MQELIINKLIDDVQNQIMSFIKDRNFKVFDIIDQKKEADSVGLELPETRLIIFGNPKVGTLLMQENDRIACELPTKILLIDEGNQTKIVYRDPRDFPDVGMLGAKGHEAIQTMHDMYLDMIEDIKLNA